MVGKSIRSRILQAGKKKFRLFPAEKKKTTNPVPIYTKSGRYTAKLTLNNAVSSNAITKKYFITVT
jgi:PKD repeat protein